MRIVILASEDHTVQPNRTLCNERGYIELSLLYMERRFNIYSIIWIRPQIFEDIFKYL